MTPTPTPHDIAQLNDIADPAVLLDGDYRILATNDAYRQVYHNGRDMTGDRCYHASHGYDRPCDASGESCPLTNCMRSLTTEKLLHIHTLPDGKEYVDVETSPIKDPHGVVRYYREILRQTLIASAKPTASGLVGISPRFIAMLDEVHKVAHERVPVLLLGESGTGKELIARAIHDASLRSRQPFVPVECSGLSETLFESELFGHHKGAFTGALFDKEGLLEIAQGGTLFLDEIGDVPPALQVKLLRLLESHTYRKVGETKTRHADFRLICATNRPLDQMMADGLFRQDLYYRISTFPIQLPPLRQRREDIGLLARSILLRIAPDHPPTLSEEASAYLCGCDFPGNIRELVNVLERARILAGGGVLTRAHFPERSDQPPIQGKETSEDPTPLWHGAAPILPLKTLERRYLQHLLETHTGTQAELARQLGISLRTLTRKISLHFGKKGYPPLPPR